MSEFVNKVVKNGGEWEIRDARIPEALSEDAGKVLKVADAGGYELGEAGGGSEFIEVNLYDGTNTTTLQDLITYFDGVNNIPTQPMKIKYGSSPAPGAPVMETIFEGYVGYKNVGDAIYSYRAYSILEHDSGNLYLLKGTLTTTSTPETVNLRQILSFNSSTERINLDVVPALPSGASSKTYVLKAVNGSLQWVEEQA